MKHDDSYLPAVPMSAFYKSRHVRRSPCKSFLQVSTPEQSRRLERRAIREAERGRRLSRG